MYTYEIWNTYIVAIYKDGVEVARNRGGNKAALIKWAKATIAAYQSGYLTSPK